MIIKIKSELTPKEEENLFHDLDFFRLDDGQYLDYEVE